MKKIFRNRAKKTAAEAGTTIGELAVLPEIKFERIHEKAKLPVYASEGDSGMDLYTVEDIVLMPGSTVIAKTGLKVEIPRHPLHEAGYRIEGQVRPRSGISATTYIRVPNAPGTVDNFFRGEIGVILSNTADRINYLSGVDFALDLKGNKIPLAETGINPDEMPPSIPANTYYIPAGTKVAQLVFNEVIRPIKIVEGKVSDEDSRGGGFGHSGINDNDNKTAVEGNE